jgi:hypothetical protein
LKSKRAEKNQGNKVITLIRQAIDTFLEEILDLPKDI